MASEDSDDHPPFDPEFPLHVHQAGTVVAADSGPRSAFAAKLASGGCSTRNSQALSNSLRGKMDEILQPHAARNECLKVQIMKLMNEKYIPELKLTPPHQVMDPK